MRRCGDTETRCGKPLDLLVVIIIVVEISSLSYSYPSQMVKQIVSFTALPMPQGDCEANVS